MDKPALVFLWPKTSGHAPVPCHAIRTRLSYVATPNKWKKAKPQFPLDKRARVRDDTFSFYRGHPLAHGHVCVQKGATRS